MLPLGGHFVGGIWIEYLEKTHVPEQTTDIPSQIQPQPITDQTQVAAVIS